MLNSENPEVGQAGSTTESAPPRRRRAASRPAGPPAVPEPRDLTSPETVQGEPAVAEIVATDVETSPEPQIVAELDTAEAPVSPPRRARRRASTVAPVEASVAAPELASDQSEVAIVEATPIEQSIADAVDLAMQPPAEPVPVTRRRRRTAAATEAASAGDEVGASLEALAESARGRRRRTVESAAEASAVLDSLAAAIGGARPVVESAAPAELDPEVAEDLETVGQAVAADVELVAEQPDTSADFEDNEDAANVTADPDAVETDAAETDEAETDEAETVENEGPEAPEVDAESGDAGESEGDESEGDEPESEGDSDSPRRRRRRRGGRRRRRGAGPEGEAAEPGEFAEPSAVGEPDAQPETDETSTEESAEGTGRRRRRRRRRGEDVGAAEDDPSDVVVRVREPRRSTRSANDEVTGIEGSTRMEAKRQRRRDGRAAGRRRAPILSEAEFLARRESVDRQMLIRQADDYTQIGVIEDGILVEHYVDRASATSLIGNVYLGRVQNVLPSMEAAFIDIGRGRNAVLYAGEIDWEGFGVTGSDRKVEKVLRSGQSILVQVSKDPVGAKGARLTAHVSIPGRYVVYSPSGQLSGISRKLPESERNRLKGILDQVVDDSASVIVRTAAEGASEDELVRDVSRLKAQWEVVEKRVKAGKSPELLYAEPDLTVRIVRDLFTEDFTQLVVDGNGKGEDAFETVDAYVRHVAPHLGERLVHWNREESGDLFEKNRIDEQIAKALERKVFLPSGGSLVIDRTEAMTVVDVNTGRFTGTSGNLEATVTSNNLEAAEEIVRQLRLRDIGGIIVVDFIDMVLPSNRELLLRRLVECLGRDRTRHQVAEVTSLGLVQMTRKKIGTGLAEAFTVECENCHGRGYHRHDTPVETQAQADGGDRDHGRGRRRN